LFGCQSDISHNKEFTEGVKSEVKSPILARINYRTVSLKDFEEILKGIKESYQSLESDLADPEIRRRVFDWVVNMEIVYQIGIERGIDKEVAEAPERVKKEFVIKKIANELKEDIAISFEEIKTFYEENRNLINQPLVEVEEDIKKLLAKSKFDEKITELVEDFKSRNKVEVNYEPAIR